MFYVNHAKYYFQMKNIIWKNRLNNKNKAICETDVEIFRNEIKRIQLHQTLIVTYLHACRDFFFTTACFDLKR